MIGRVTPGYMVNDFLANLHAREEKMQNVQNQLSTGYRINLPSQDPVGTINFMDFDSRLKEINTYQTIVNNAQSKIKVVDSNLNSVTEILQRIRELAVQGANGIYTKEERRNMAVEADQLLREILQLANSYYKDNALFGGTMVDETPFKPTIQTDPDTGTEFVKDVRYIGNNQSQIIEAERGEIIDINQPGNQIFWADNMEIYSTLNVSGYTAPIDSKIVVDGVEINISSGDNLEVIVQKINKAGVAVKASIITREGASYLALESTSPHQISLMDTDGGRVLQDLGFIDHGMNPPYNYSPAARVYTGSVFDVLINFRKALLSNDIFKIGGTALAQIDQSLSNVLKFRAHLGAVSQRLEKITDRFLADEAYITEAKDNSIGTDISKSIIDMKTLEFSHDVALNIGARILPKTLLDFLR